MGRRNISGGAEIMHGLKELGGTARNGLKVLHESGRKQGRQEGFQQGVNYALTKLNVWERLTGHVSGRK